MYEKQSLTVPNDVQAVGYVNEVNDAFGYTLNVIYIVFGAGSPCVSAKPDTVNVTDVIVDTVGGLKF